MKILVLLPLLLISLATLATPLTVNTWKDLNEKQQLNIIKSAAYNGEQLPYTNYEVIEYKDHSLVTNSEHESYIKEVYKVISNNISYDDIEQSIGSDTGYGLITAPVIHLTILVTKDTDEILGTYAYIYFQGAYKKDITPDDHNFYFMTKQEAINYGFDPEQDISWSGELYLKNSASLFSDQFLTFEWSGW